MKSCLAAALLVHLGGAALVWTSWDRSEGPIPSNRGLEVAMVRLPTRPLSTPPSPLRSSPRPESLPSNAFPALPMEQGKGNFLPASLPEGFTVAYPPEARRGAGKEGTVILEAEVAETGQVTGVILKDSSGHPILDQAALNQLFQTRLRPATLDGIPVSSHTRVSIIFQLR